MREQRRVFGEVAEAYDDVRPGYPMKILDHIVAYAGHTPSSIVEAGAGTGKGTALLRTLHRPLTCVEPDPAMAAVLKRRFDGDDLVSVIEARFEDWTPPPAGVDLLASAQAWHWVDAQERSRLAYAALKEGGVIAIFGHEFGFADDEMVAAMDEVYLRIAPEIADPKHVNGGVRHAGAFDPDELRPWFDDLQEREVVTMVPFETPRYLALLTTFSGHRMLPEDRRERLHHALARLIDERGGVVQHKLTTGLSLGRKARTRKD